MVFNNRNNDPLIDDEELSKSRGFLYTIFQNRDQNECFGSSMDNLSLKKVLSDFRHSE